MKKGKVVNKSKGIVSWPQEERPRERLLSRGPEALTDAELIAILLRVGLKGTNAVELGRQLLPRFGSLRAMVEAPVLDLLSVKGLKGAKAAQLMAAIEIARRAVVPARTKSLTIKNTTVDGGDFMKSRKVNKEELKDIPLHVRAEMALKEAVAEAIAEHKRMGRSIVVWKDGKVVKIPPEEIVVPLP